MRKRLLVECVGIFRNIGYGVLLAMQTSNKYLKKYFCFFIYYYIYIHIFTFLFF